MFMHCHCFLPRTTDTDEHFVAYKVHQTKTETLYYTGDIKLRSRVKITPKSTADLDKLILDIVQDIQMTPSGYELREVRKRIEKLL